MGAPTIRIAPREQGGPRRAALPVMTADHMCRCCRRSGAVQERAISSSPSTALHQPITIDRAERQGAAAHHAEPYHDDGLIDDLAEALVDVGKSSDCRSRARTRRGVINGARWLL